ncbi:bifunctional riboflavin kinase/FAD synthetase [Aurantivibrio plasticivorans]
MTEQPKQLIRGRINLRPEHHGSVVTIGAFDGVHLGHRAVLKQAISKARQLNLPAVAIIFEPLPREYFQRSQSVARILPFREKCLALFECGIDRVLCLSFNKALSQQSPEDFIEEILLEGLGVKHLVVGDDFKFGQQRRGDKALLEQYAAQHGFTMESAQTVCLEGERVSSTRIRELLAQGDFASAEACLGRPFTIAGRVKYGRQLGRQLGVPTANVDLKRLTSPFIGTYAGHVNTRAGEYFAVINVGMRPTVNNEPKALLEAHLLDFSGDLYGQRVVVRFQHKLRDEQKFESLQSLQAQIQQDIKNAQTLFKADAANKTT